MRSRSATVSPTVSTPLAASRKIATAATWLTAGVATVATSPSATPTWPSAVVAASSTTAGSQARLPDRWMWTTATRMAVAGSTRLQPAIQV